MKKSFIFFTVSFFTIVTSLAVYLSYFSNQSLSSSSTPVLRVMAYSNFLKSWGAGKDLAQTFEAKYGVRIEWIEVGNAGMILENLQKRKQEQMPDVVVGLDLLSLPDARKTIRWKNLDLPSQFSGSELPKGVFYKDFMPFDWAPMTFIFRRGEIKAPVKLNELLLSQYTNSLALQDPTVSATGLYFLIWILSLDGEASGFKYLEMLKPSIRIVSPSWSSSYSLFQNSQVPMVFSYFTSTIYHYENEKDYRYQPVYFDDPHIYAVEYLGIPEDCKKCDVAQEFIKHVLSKDSQKLIMEKNFMLPVLASVKAGTPFDFPKSIKLIDPKSYEVLLEKKEEILKKWSDLHL